VQARTTLLRSHLTLRSLAAYSTCMVVLTTVYGAVIACITAKVLTSNVSQNVHNSRQVLLKQLASQLSASSLVFMQRSYGCDMIAMSCDEMDVEVVKQSNRTVSLVASTDANSYWNAERRQKANLAAWEARKAGKLTFDKENKMLCIGSHARLKHADFESDQDKEIALLCSIIEDTWIVTDEQMLLVHVRSHQGLTFMYQT
jgi:hypothetical protein